MFQANLYQINLGCKTETFMGNIEHAVILSELNSAEFMKRTNTKV